MTEAEEAAVMEKLRRAVKYNTLMVTLVGIVAISGVALFTYLLILSPSTPTGIEYFWAAVAFLGIYAFLLFAPVIGMCVFVSRIHGAGNRHTELMAQKYGVGKLPRNPGFAVELGDTMPEVAIKRMEEVFSSLGLRRVKRGDRVTADCDRMVPGGARGIKYFFPIDIFLLVKWIAGMRIIAQANALPGGKSRLEVFTVFPYNYKGFAYDLLEKVRQSAAKSLNMPAHVKISEKPLAGKVRRKHLAIILIIVFVVMPAIGIILEQVYESGRASDVVGAVDIAGVESPAPGTVYRLFTYEGDVWQDTFVVEYRFVHWCSGRAEISNNENICLIFDYTYLTRRSVTPAEFYSSARLPQEEGVYYDVLNSPRGLQSVFTTSTDCCDATSGRYCASVVEEETFRTFSGIKKYYHVKVGKDVERVGNVCRASERIEIKRGTARMGNIAVEDGRVFWSENANGRWEFFMYILG